MSSDQLHQSPRRVAIIGGGISGIACLWRLRNENCEVHLYEAEDRLGGHANSVPFVGNRETVSVDTGFISFNAEMYPEFNGFLQELEVQTIETDMSFGVSEDDGAFEWGSASFWSFFGKLSHLFSLWFWRLVFDIIRFNYFATDILLSSRAQFPNDGSRLLNLDESEKHGYHVIDRRTESIGEYLDRNNYSKQFIRYYIIPMVAAPWCIDPDEFSRSFPARALIHFMAEHRLLQTISHKLQWRAFQHGSQTYIDAFSKTLKPHHHLHLQSPIRNVSRDKNGFALVRTPGGLVEEYDHVVLAVHANQALDILGEDATIVERDVLSAFKTSRNICVLHSDTTLLPKRPSARVSWNCLMRSQCSQASQQSDPGHMTMIQSRPSDEPISLSSTERISITFDMNRLQGIPLPGNKRSPGRVLVTMNPIRDPLSTQSRHVYYHPIISSESISAAERLSLVNSASNVKFAGAWMGYGFHEDGFVAGRQVAEGILNADMSTERIRYGNQLTEWISQTSPADRTVRAIINAVQFFVDRLNRDVVVV